MTKAGETMMGFGSRKDGEEVSPPVLKSRRLIGHLPTELAIPAVQLDEDAIAIAEAVRSGCDEAVFLVGPEGHVYALDEGAPLAPALGLDLESLRGKAQNLVAEEDWLRIVAALRKVAETPGATGRLTFPVRTPSGKPVTVHARAQNRLDEPIGATVVHIRQTEEPSETKHPQVHLAPSDDQEAFFELLSQVIQRKVDKVWDAPSHARHVMRDRRWDYAVVLIYLDRFNILLGSFGGEARGQIMREACARVQTVLRSGDAVAQVDKTELAVVLRGVSEPSHVDRLTELLLDTLQAPIDAEGTAVTLRPIAGVASSRRRYDDIDGVLRDAAAAAGRALQSGTSKHRSFETEFRVEPLQRMNMMAALRDGIDDGELYLMFQPVVSLASGAFTALEAYVRWQHPDRGLIMPGDFIPLAEETGLIRPLTAWVLEQGCRTIRGFEAADELRLHINVGAGELGERAFVADVLNALQRLDFPARRLCFDLSESALLEDSEVVRESMHRLNGKGVRFALDDYGTGASSLRYLADLPFDYVKMDTSVSQHVDDTQRRIARAMIGLAHELGHEVIAEGVESGLQRNALKNLGSDEAQGYFFSKPLDEDQMRVKLRDLA